MSNKVYSVVELKKDSTEQNFHIDRNKLFSTRKKAVSYLHERYLDCRSLADLDNEGEFSADYDEESGWYSVVAKDDTIYEGYVSDGLEVE